MAAFIRYRQVRQLQHLRNNRDSLDVLRFAQQHIGTVSTDMGSTALAGLNTMLNATAAASLAALGDGACAIELLERCEFDATVSTSRTWLGWRHSAELTAQYGRVYRDLARGDVRYAEQAIYWTKCAIDEFDGSLRRSSLLNLVGLCSAWFLAGEPDEALTVGQHLLRAETAIQSARVRDRVGNIVRDAQPWIYRSDVADFVDAIASKGNRVD